MKKATLLSLVVLLLLISIILLPAIPVWAGIRTYNFPFYVTTNATSTEVPLSATDGTGGIRLAGYGRLPWTRDPGVYVTSIQLKGSLKSGDRIKLEARDYLDQVIDDPQYVNSVPFNWEAPSGAVEVKLSLVTSSAAGYRQAYVSNWDDTSGMRTEYAPPSVPPSDEAQTRSGSLDSEIRLTPGSAAGYDIAPIFVWYRGKIDVNLPPNQLVSAPFTDGSNIQEIKLGGYGEVKRLYVVVYNYDSKTQKVVKRYITVQANQKTVQIKGNYKFVYLQLEPKSFKSKLTESTLFYIESVTTDNETTELPLPATYEELMP